MTADKKDGATPADVEVREALERLEYVRDHLRADIRNDDMMSALGQATATLRTLLSRTPEPRGWCRGCGDSIPMSEVDSVGGHAGIGMDSEGYPEQVHCGPVDPREPRGDAVGEIRKLVEKHFDNVRYYSDSYHLAPRWWAQTTLSEIRTILARTSAPDAGESQEEATDA